ncbi:putative splicing factor, arginine/serine-rich 6 [Podospora australis]|uniref:Splicing factor, arginine/serine-rich 6 n=1 Tax=Podospora australis TaxID=1536484 RepID=A0AAN7AKM6_9PEZI|nr:putative splicing factor, arginine/serine-rich 6 [Podospora australis]
MSLSEQSPEILAAASLSPLSPKPISIQNTSIVHMLQDQAATTDTAPTPTPVHPPPQQEHAITMSMDQDQDAAADTIVVGGAEYMDDDSHDESNDSDASGESIDYDEDVEVQDQTVPTDAQNDDYAKSFDSPVGGQSPSEAAVAAEEAAQPDVPQTSESIKNSSSSPEPHESNTLPAESLPARPSSPPTHHANGFSLSESTAPSTSKPMSTEETINPSPATADDLNHAAAPADEPASSPAAKKDDDDGAVDIQNLINKITTQAATTTVVSPQTSAAPSVASSAMSHPPPSLPPKPSVPAHSGNLPALPPHTFQQRGSSGPSSSTSSLMSVPNHGSSSRNSYLPRASNDNMSSMSRPPAYANQANNQNQAHFQNAPNMNPSGKPYHNVSTGQRAWETFLVDEKKYTSEQNWDRFPEGSRIFIGNLSSDRVSKREVFDIFSQYGKLAQISLKSAYGFVQYHTIAEGQLAVQRAEGMELGGRKIHLEVSKTQKKDREQSPNRRNGRTKTEHGWERDDYRHRSPSPRRDMRGSRDGPLRHREFGGVGAHERRRSRSPPRHNNRYGNDSSYRRRDPTPPRGPESFDADGLGIPRRYGPDVPDVQLLMLPEVSRDFVTWVQHSIQGQGLRTDVMLLNPRFPRDTIVRRMILEGVHAIIDLDSAAQAQGRFDIQVFQRGMDTTTRFELYKSLDPATAAALVHREKSRAAAYPPQGQPQPYRTEAAAPAGYPYQQYPRGPVPPVVPAPAAPAAAPELSNMVRNLDNNTLQYILANLQSSQTNQAHTAAGPYGQAPPPTPQQQGNPDITTLLQSMQNAVAAAPQQAYSAGPQAYMGAGAPPYPPAAPGPGVPANPAQRHDIQTIMDHLRRAAQ